METIGLDGCLAKVRRAQTHFKTLYGEAGDFFRKGELYEEVPEFDAETGWYKIKLRVFKQPPIEWGLILGDMIHNLRSALDQLVWQLVLLNGKKPRRQNGFPIAADRDWFDREGVPKMLARVAPHDIEAIRAVQPYHRGDGAESHPLELLNWLNRVDKHQVIHTTLAALGNPVHPTPIAWFSNAPILETRANLGALYDGMELAAARIPIGAEPDLEMQGHFASDIRVGEHSLTHLLLEIGPFVDRFIKGFIPRYD